MNLLSPQFGYRAGYLDIFRKTQDVMQLGRIPSLIGLNLKWILRRTKEPFPGNFFKKVIFIFWREGEREP